MKAQGTNGQRLLEIRYCLSAARLRRLTGRSMRFACGLSHCLIVPFREPHHGTLLDTSHEKVLPPGIQVCDLHSKAVG